MVISGMPAMATMSPGRAISAGTRSSASVINISDSLILVIVPSDRHQATTWFRRISPAKTRHRASRPR